MSLIDNIVWTRVRIPHAPPGSENKISDYTKQRLQKLEKF